MDWGLVVLTLLCFGGGIFLSRWQARRQFRARLADQLAREVEKVIAREAVSRLAQQDVETAGRKAPATPPE